MSNLWKTYQESKEIYPNSANKRFSSVVRHSDELLDELKKETDFLSGDASVSERLYCFVHDIHEIRKCPYCGKPLLYTGKMDKGYYATCGSAECRKLGMAKGATNRSDDAKSAAAAKAKETYFKKTGYYSNMQDPAGYAKWKASFEDKHGEEHPLQVNEIKDKVKETTLSRYGTLDMFHCDKSVQTILEKYGSLETYYKQTNEKTVAARKEKCKNEILQRLTDFDFTLVDDTDLYSYKIKCNQCGHEFSCSREYINYYWRNQKRFCPKCDFKNMTFRSGSEKELGEIIASIYDGEIRCNKYIGKYECDIVIPDKKLAIDYNGIYWHSELYKDKEYHIKKKKSVAAAGYNLIYIWEDDWNDIVKQEIILSRIRSKLGLSEKIFARKCDIKKLISGDELSIAKKFLENNHLHGYTPASDYYGLFHKEELVELISIGKSRKLIGSKKDQHELIRLCSKKNVNVVGGFSKLLKYVMKDLSINELTSYIDLDWTDIFENSYKSVGFSTIDITAPNYWWSKDGLRYNRLNFTKAKLITEGESIGKTENEIMKERGYVKLWGTGNLKVKYDFNKT